MAEFRIYVEDFEREKRQAGMHGLPAPALIEVPPLFGYQHHGWLAK